MMRVSKNGKAWCAYRKTVSGWVLGIGAAGPPPNQWLYDGAQAPSDYPGRGASWGQGPFETPPNWLANDS